MYGWLWRHLPGDPRTKAIGVAFIAALALAALWFAVFPWAASHLPIDGGAITG
jgi:hypothetical protein